MVQRLMIGQRYTFFRLYAHIFSVAKKRGGCPIPAIATNVQAEQRHNAYRYVNSPPDPQQMHGDFTAAGDTTVDDYRITDFKRPARSRIGPAGNHQPCQSDAHHQ